MRVADRLPSQAVPRHQTDLSLSIMRGLPPLPFPPFSSYMISLSHIHECHACASIVAGETLAPR